MKTLKLLAIVAPQPDFPPDLLELAREDIVGVGPQPSESRASEGCNTIDCLFMARLPLLRLLVGVLLKPTDEVLQLAIRNEYSGALNRRLLWIELHWSNRNNLDALTLVFERLDFQFNTGRTIELNVNARLRALYDDLTLSTGFGICLGGHEGGPQGCSMPLTIGWTLKRRRRNLSRMRCIWFGAGGRSDHDMATISRGGHA
jgi:hypothetical protein